MTKKEKEDQWAKFKKDPSKLLGGGIENAFSWGRFTATLINLIFAYIISLIIEQPLLSLARFIRTLEWSYAFNIISYSIFIGLITIIITLFYKISKSIRGKIVETIESQRDAFFINFLSFVFAILVIDVFIEPLLALSDFLATGIWVFDLGSLIDRIIASLLLLFIYMFIYELSKLYWKYY
jgi:hypothetical protein